MRLKPAPGLKVRDHVTRLQIPEGGIDVATIDGAPGVPADPYWQRLLRDKDVVDADASVAAEHTVAEPIEAPAEHSATHDADPSAEHQ